MTNSIRVDVFTGVHKGLRKALFNLSEQASRTDAVDTGALVDLAKKAAEVFHFAAHHALNEDRFLVPDMEAKSMPEAAFLQDDHAKLDADLEHLREMATQLPRLPEQLSGFYLSLNRFVSDYLRHLHEEETAVLPALHARFTDAELTAFSQKSVAATLPADQDMMLSYMFPVMTSTELKGFFDGLQGKVPAEVMQRLKGIARI